MKLPNSSFNSNKIFQRNRITVHENLAEDMNIIPDFMIKGNITNTVCRVQEPFIGEIVVEKSDREIRSIELQLIRVEIITGKN